MTHPQTTLDRTRERSVRCCQREPPCGGSPPCHAPSTVARQLLRLACMARRHGSITTVVSRFAAVAAIATVVVARPAPAYACTPDDGPPMAPRNPWWSADDFPTNGLFVSSLEWRSSAGPLELVEDAALTALWGTRVRRPTMPLPSGAVFEATECAAPCVHELRVGSGPDVSPPSPAKLIDVRTLLVRAPDPGGAFSCGDTDRLEITISGADDNAPTDELAIAGYVGADEPEIATHSAPDIVFGSDYDAPLRATIWLGQSAGRQRNGLPFRASDRFCFAVALVDRAGNVGDRSGTTCLDTTDPNDPTVVWVDSEGCGCHGTRGGGSPVLLPLALWVVVDIRRRRRGVPR